MEGTTCTIGEGLGGFDRPVTGRAKQMEVPGDYHFNVPSV